MTLTPVLCPLLFAVLFKSVWVGVGENRFYYDRGPVVSTWMGRLTTYHLWLFLSFAVFNVSYVAFFGLLFPTQTHLLTLQALTLAFLTIYDVFVLDVTWWLIRYVDIQFLHRDYYDNRDGQAWHKPSDWDAAGLPLWMGTYLWWWLCFFVLVGLGVAVLVLLFV